jgi:hypothetical protein
VIMSRCRDSATRDPRDSGFDPIPEGRAEGSNPESRRRQKTR